MTDKKQDKKPSKQEKADRQSDDRGGQRDEATVNPEPRRLLSEQRDVSTPSRSLSAPETLRAPEKCTNTDCVDGEVWKDDEFLHRAGWYPCPYCKPAPKEPDKMTDETKIEILEAVAYVDEHCNKSGGRTLVYWNEIKLDMTTLLAEIDALTQKVKDLEAELKGIRERVIEEEAWEDIIRPI